MCILFFFNIFFLLSYFKIINLFIANKMTEKLNEIKDTAKVVANDIKDFIDVNISE